MEYLKYLTLFQDLIGKNKIYLFYLSGY